MFPNTEPHFCPECSPVYNKAGKQVGERLELVEADYSGLGIDLADCPKCKKIFYITYKVDTIAHWE